MCLRESLCVKVSESFNQGECFAGFPPTRGPPCPVHVTLDRPREIYVHHLLIIIIIIIVAVTNCAHARIGQSRSHEGNHIEAMRQGI